MISVLSAAAGNLLRLMPRRVPLNVVVGPAVPVPHVASNDPAFSQLVDEYHKMYMEALQKLWDDHKDKYAPDRMREMRFVA
jgi:2-acylglycerol O-acyltransferase 2